MTDNELLLAISNMLDPMREDIQVMKEDIQGMKEDIQGMKEDIQGIHGDIEGIHGDIQDIKTRVKKIEIIQENEILPRLNTIESCYTSTYDRYKDNVETYETMQQDISIMKKVIAEHSEKFQKLA